MLFLQRKPLLQRKFIDLIHHVSSKWVNWDPPIPVEVGAYGEVDRDTGDLRVEGNIYSLEFQQELDRLGVRLFMNDHRPLEGSVEEDFIICSKGAKRVDFHLAPEATFAGLVNASIKGRWRFEQGKRDALLFMHRPRIRFLPPDGTLETLLKVDRLKNKSLVTRVHVCPAFFMYLSNKSGETASLALGAQVPIPGAPGVAAGGGIGIGWCSDTQADFLRKACDPAGNYCYTPLYNMKQRRPVDSLRLLRGGGERPNRDEVWDDALISWDPLDEDGDEDVVVQQDDPNELM